MNDSSDVKEIKKNLYSNSCIQLYKKKKEKKKNSYFCDTQIELYLVEGIRQYGYQKLVIRRVNLGLHRSSAGNLAYV